VFALSENRSSDDLTREMHDVAVRRSLGRAAEVLALWRSTGLRPEAASEVLREAASRLEKPLASTSGSEQARSLGNYRPQVHLLVQASAAFESEGVQSLQEVSSVLTTLAETEPSQLPEIDDALQKLHQLRRAIANSRTRSVEQQQRDHRR
jgi:hypothetical protein